MVLAILYGNFLFIQYCIGHKSLKVIQRYIDNSAPMKEGNAQALSVPNSSSAGLIVNFVMITIF